jgi:multidrug efflux pump subunit AcrB
MERSAAIPLEDALASITGVKQVLSTSENGRVRVFVRFDRSVPGLYEAVREAAQRVYETLPRSAQRPEIAYSGDSRIPVWTAAVSSLRDEAPGSLLEKVIKPALEGVEGVGEVEISGSGLPEIVVALKPGEAALRGLSPSALAAVLAMDDLLLPGGVLRHDGRDTPILVDGRYEDSASLARALIPLGKGPPLILKELADIVERDREPDTLSRLNGRRTAIVSILAASGADLGKLSRALGRELIRFEALPLEFKVLSDRGAEEAAAFHSVLVAAAQGALAVALMAALLCSRRSGAVKGVALLCALAVPLICLISLALLLAAGREADRALLAGIAAGVGAAVDTVILCADGLGKVRGVREGRAALFRLLAPLVSGSVTTAAALIPLIFLKLPLSAGIRTIAQATAMVSLVSLAAALVLLPPLLLRGSRSAAPKPRRLFVPIPARLFRLFRRRGLRLLAGEIQLCAKRPLAVFLFWILLSAGGGIALFLAGADTGPDPSGNSVYAQVEFEGGLRPEEADRRLAAYAEALLGREGIEQVETGARPGSGSVLVYFDSRRISPAEVREAVRNEAVSGGFVYIPENASGERIWEISIAGEEDEKCRELAEEAARLCVSLPLVRETVLNFKEGGRGVDLIPDRERLRESGTGFSAAADTIRRSIHGPVAYKRVGSAGETDVRIRGSGPEFPERAELGNILILSGGGDPLLLDSLMEEKEIREPVGIRRADRRRIASISIRTKPMDPRLVRDRVMEVLKTLELPPGYVLEFDREALAAAEALSGTVLHFLAALLLCAMVIAAANESFGMPLAALSVVPPSLAFPALGMGAAGLPIGAEAACAFVAVSGVAVNASVLIADEIRHGLEAGREGSRGLYRAIRNRLPVLAATAGTTIAGALPFLFLREGSNQAVRLLSLVSVLGVGASCVCSVTLLPALAKTFPNLFRTFEAPFRAASS